MHLLPVLLAMYIAVAQRRGIDRNKLRGTIQNDILKEYIARGTYIFPPTPSMRLITDTFSYCKENLPNWNTISISGYHIREAGSTAVQEVAFTLANAIAYVEAALNAGMEIDEFAAQLSFFFNAHNNFLEEIAKFRAARRLWAKITKERFGARDPKSSMLRFHTQTGGSTLTAQQPENNIVRVAIQALAAVMGGTQSLHTNSMDEALRLPTEKSVRIALKTQQIIAYETGAADSVDPLGGSYLIEYLTDKIESEATEYIKKIDHMGGALKAIQYGFMQKEIQDASYRNQKDIENGEQVVVGVNSFAIPEEINLDSVEVDVTIEKQQCEHLNKLRMDRDQEIVNTLLTKLENAALGSQNLMPYLIDCVENRATLGEICGVLRKYGENTSLRIGHKVLINGGIFMQKGVTIKKINHIAIVVPDMDEGIKFWRDALGLTLDRIEYVASQKSEVAFFPVGNGEVELVKPTDDQSGLAKFLETRWPRHASSLS